MKFNWNAEFPSCNSIDHFTSRYTLQGTNISPTKALLKMIFLFLDGRVFPSFLSWDTITNSPLAKRIPWFWVTPPKINIELIENDGLEIIWFSFSRGVFSGSMLSFLCVISFGILRHWCHWFVVVILREYSFDKIKWPNFNGNPGQRISGPNRSGSLTCARV